MDDQTLSDESTCQLPLDVQTRPENDGVTLIYGGGRAPFLANETAAEILRMLQGPRSVRMLIDEMATLYPTASEDALRADILGLLDRLIKERYVISTSEGTLVNGRPA